MAKAKQASKLPTSYEILGARIQRVDPETVLKRKPRYMSLAERRALKKMAEAL